MLATWLQHQNGDDIVYSSREALNTWQGQDKILLSKEHKNKICSFIFIFYFKHYYGGSFIFEIDTPLTPFLFIKQYVVSYNCLAHLRNLSKKTVFPSRDQTCVIIVGANL